LYHFDGPAIRKSLQLLTRVSAILQDATVIWYKLTALYTSYLSCFIVTDKNKKQNSKS